MNTEYYLIRKRAVPKVLLQVAEVNRLLASGEALTVSEAVRKVGIGKSSYYKYQGDIEEFHDSLQGTTLTLSLDISDKTGVLSDILKVIAHSRANILTIHQSIPIGGVASVSISVQILEETVNLNTMVEDLEKISGVRRLKIAGRQD